MCLFDIFYQNFLIKIVELCFYPNSYSKLYKQVNKAEEAFQSCIVLDCYETYTNIFIGFPSFSKHTSNKKKSLYFPLAYQWPCAKKSIKLHAAEMKLLPVGGPPGKNFSAFLGICDTIHRFLWIFTFCNSGNLDIRA